MTRFILKRNGFSSGPRRPSSQLKGDVFGPERQRSGNKKQRQEIEDREKERESGQRGQGDLSRYASDKETDVVHRKIAVYERWRGNPVFG